MFTGNKVSLITSDKRSERDSMAPIFLLVISLHFEPWQARISVKWSKLPFTLKFLNTKPRF